MIVMPESSKSKITVLVTGGAGFIGSNLIAELLNQNYRVVCVDNFDDVYSPLFKEENISPYLQNKNFILERVDICDQKSLEAIFEREKPEYVIHLAAKVDTRDAVNLPYVYIKVNIEGTLNILELSKKYQVKNLVIASSSSVYGNSQQLPWREDECADRQLSPYGMTKRSVELLAHSYYHNFGMNIVCLRYFNVYGENNRPSMVPYIWAEKLLRGEEIEISGDGSRRRDYTYVLDVVRGTISAMKKPLGFEIINIGNSSPVSLKDLLMVFEKVIGVSAKIKNRPSNHASVENTFADVSKAKELLDWTPTTSIEEGIAKLVLWFRNNRLKDRV